jgi:hypothetical protein
VATQGPSDGWGPVVSAEAIGVRLNPDVFISYRRTDKEFVERFVTALEDHGPEVWWDADILAGDDWRRSIVENLTNSGCLVIVFSRDCNDSTQLVKELGVADRLKKIVIPVKIDDSEPSGSLLYELAWRNWIDVHPDPTSKLDVAAARVVESLKQAGWTPPRQGPPTSERPLPAPTVVAPSESAAPHDGFAPPSQPPSQPPSAGTPIAGRPQQPAAHPVPPSTRFRLREAFPFHWTDFVVPVLAFILLFVAGLLDGGWKSLAGTLGLALFTAVAVLALIGLIAFPIRYYRRRANPYRVARNLVVSNLTFAVGAAIASWLAWPLLNELLEDDATTASDTIEASIGFVIFGSLFAIVSFVIFFALSKVRAKRELRAHTQVV